MSSKSNVTLQLDTVKFSKKQLEISEISSKGVAHNLYTRVLEGEVSAVDTAEMISFVNKVGEELKSMTDEMGKNKFTDLVREEIVKNADGGKSFVTKRGSKVELFTASGGKIDYSVCKHPYYDYLTEKEEEIKKTKKKLENYLKTIEVPCNVGNITNPETGEIYENVELFPIVQNKTETYKLQLLKD